MHSSITNTITCGLLGFICLVVITLPQYGDCGTTISCFTCASRNGSDPACEDPFNATSSSYTALCKVPRRARDGLFPAHFCIKLIGTSYTTKEKLTIRWCSLENLDNMCGDFKLSKEFYRGCILTCDRDGCNSSETTQLSINTLILGLITLMFNYVFIVQKLSCVE